MNNADNLSMPSLELIEEQMTPEQREILNKKSSPDAIPNLVTLTKHVYEILEFLEKDEIKRLCKVNMGAIRNILNNKYAETVPYGIISLLLNENERYGNLEILLEMFNTLKNAKNGNISMDHAEKTFGECITKKYIYSKYGSREGFEKAMNNSKSINTNNTNIKNIGKATIKK